MYGNTTPEGRSVFVQFRVFPTSTSVDITIYQYGKNVLYFFYNIAMSKARTIRKISVFTSGGKFPVLTLSYINTALSQSAFRIYKCYIIKNKYKTFSVLIYSYINTRGNWENSKLCENTVSTQFRVFPISTRVDITVYQHGKCFIFIKYHLL